MQSRIRLRQAGYETLSTSPNMELGGEPLGDVGRSRPTMARRDIQRSLPAGLSAISWSSGSQWKNPWSVTTTTRAVAIVSQTADGLHVAVEMCIRPR